MSVVSMACQCLPRAQKLSKDPAEVAKLPSADSTSEDCNEISSLRSVSNDTRASSNHFLRQFAASDEI